MIITILIISIMLKKTWCNINNKIKRNETRIKRHVSFLITNNYIKYIFHEVIVFSSYNNHKHLGMKYISNCPYRMLSKDWHLFLFQKITLSSILQKSFRAHAFYATSRKYRTINLQQSVLVSRFNFSASHITRSNKKIFIMTGRWVT